MIEVPLWIFVLICIATYINFLQLLSLASKLKKNNVQDMINGQIVSKGFDDIANDMDDLVRKVDKLEAIHEYRESKK
jgi:hypothetical protein